MEKTICDGRSWCGLGSWFGGVALEGFHVWGLLVEVAAHLFLICHGQATPSLISYAYSFTCAPIFLSFLILQSFVPLVLGLFLFLFFGENVELFDFMGFFFLCVFVSQEKFWVYGFAGDWVGYCFMGLFLGFIFCFFGFDGDWAWLLDLDLGFARDWFSCFLDLGRTWRKFHVSI